MFLLLSFLVLREEESKGHYMSVGLCVALMMLEVRAVQNALGWKFTDFSFDVVELDHPAWNEAG